ncbi:MAG: hypothetical protein ACTSUP_01645 [Candidatus Heimdallarchaeaceae archaeon]
MLSAREYVEIMTCRRLNRHLPDDREVPIDEFNALWNRISTLVNSLSHNTKIRGFSTDDLRGFFAMKVHQTLRRNQYNKNLPPFGFYKTNFDNLLKNLNRELNNTENKLRKSEDLLDFITDSNVFEEFHQIVL